MYQPVYTKQFRKDTKRIQKSGNKDIEKLKIVVRILLDGKQLASFYKDHNLRGSDTGRRECHIEPDWLLVYKLNRKEKTIIFERSGSHADIFE